MCMQICVYLGVCACAYVFLCVCVCVCVCVCKSVCFICKCGTNVFSHTHTLTRTNTHAQTNTQTHTHTHAHTHLHNDTMTQTHAMFTRQPTQFITFPRGGGFETNYGANEATFVLVLLVCALIDAISPALGSIRRFLLLRVVYVCVCWEVCVCGCVWVRECVCMFVGGFVYMDVCV